MIFALFGSGLVALTQNLTQDRIAENYRQEVLNNLNLMISADLYDNQPVDDHLEFQDSAHFHTDQPITVYRLRKHGLPVALIMAVTAPNGYSGDINLMVGIMNDGQLSGVRVLAHKETPGLGDRIEREKSDWILNFQGRSLNNPLLPQWSVKKDGGAFDQLTGATITPRAITETVKWCLLYAQQHRDRLFSLPSVAPTPS
jgi:Na+-translocating ferredoxin:NAD+ oxidoreductase subunit G